MAPTEPVVDLAGAVVTSGGFPLLSGVTLRIDGPGATVLTGANGAGKTSVLRLVGGLLPLAGGSARVLGVDLATGDRRALRRRCGWLGHEGAFYDGLSVRENLQFAARAMARPLSEIDVALERVELSARANTLAKSLSAGQRRRMGLAWLLVRRPELWLLDEPYASLDVAARDLLASLLVDVVAAGACVVMTSHDPVGGALNPREVRLVGGREAGGAT
jgi:heme ABC exporter ATP-binding subunit CcmA